MGKLCGCVDIDIECKNIPILADITGGGGVILSTKWSESGIPKTFFVLGYLHLLTGSKIYQNKTWEFFIKDG